MVAVLLLGLALMSCSERSNPTDFPKINERGSGNDGVYTQPRTFNTISQHAGYEFFQFSVSKNFYIKFYTPPAYQDFGAPLPILYLLHDFKGDENYYFDRMIHRIADSLIYEDEIEQFYIVSVDVSTPYGGSWYTNNDFFGWFEDMIYDELISFIEDELPQLKVLKDRDSRAIGGFGMGGYGALKIAAKHPELYSSVSTSNCAGKFDGEGSMRGVDALIDNMLAEQGLSTPIANFEDAFDTTGMFSSKPYTLLFFSMAQAFSPHPFDEEDPQYTDSTTYLPFYGIDLPFDYNGNLYQPIWDKWVANDLDAILTAHAGDFDSIALYMEYGDADQFYFNEQAQAIMGICDDLGIEYDDDTYTGYEGYPATNQAFIYDRLVKILKFHSRHLETEL